MGVLPLLTLWRIDEGVLFVAALASFLVMLEIAFRVGRRYRSTGDDVGRAHISALQSGLLGLLSLLLGFNFAMAASRFDARKTLLQDEVNAVRMTYLRAQLLPGTQRDTISDLLHDYVDARVAAVATDVNRAKLDSANAQASRIETQLWAITGDVAEGGNATVQLSLFIQSLNELINVNDRRRAAQDNHVPETVINLLFSVALGALAYIAYGYGLAGKRRHLSTAIFALLIAMVLTIILDLDRPRRGLIRIDEQGMIRLQQAMIADTSSH
jgi:hypothetical protein